MSSQGSWPIIFYTPLFLALVQISGREAGCLFFCSPFITPMKTLIICIPPELSSAGEVKKFLRWLSEEIRGFWEPRCPGCGSKRVWRAGAEPRKTAPPAQRYECPRCGKKFCDRTGTPFYRKHAPSARIFSAFTLFLVGLSFRAAPGGPRGVSHVTVAGMVHGAGTREDPRGRRRWIGDETFVRVAGKTMYQGSGWWTGGAGLSRGFSPPEGGRPRPRDGPLPGASKRMRQARMSARRKPGIPPSPQEPRPGLEGGSRRAQEGVGRPGDGSTTNPLEGEWSHFRCWCGVHRGFKRWANAQHYHEQYVRARNHPEKTLIQLLIPDK